MWGENLCHSWESFIPKAAFYENKDQQPWTVGCFVGQKPCDIQEGINKFPMWIAISHSSQELLGDLAKHLHRNDNAVSLPDMKTLGQHQRSACLFAYLLFRGLCLLRFTVFYETGSRNARYKALLTASAVHWSYTSSHSEHLMCTSEHMQASGMVLIKKHCFSVHFFMIRTQKLV